MSYCRFSSNNFNCDAYIYEDVNGGWTIHLVANRVIGDIPKLPKFTKKNASEFEIDYKRKKL